MQNIKWGKVLVLLSLVGGIIALDMGIRPMVREAAASQTQIAVNRMIQRAVLEVLEEDGLRYQSFVATVYKGNIIKNLIMDCQSYTKYRPNETTGGIFVSWRRKEELPTGA